MQNTFPTVTRGTQPPTPRWGFHDREHLEGLLSSILKVDERTAQQLEALKFDDEEEVLEATHANSRLTADAHDVGFHHKERELMSNDQTAYDVNAQRRTRHTAHDSRPKQFHTPEEDARSRPPITSDYHRKQLRQTLTTVETGSRIVRRQNHRKEYKSPSISAQTKLMRSNSNLQTPRPSLTNSQFSSGTFGRSSVLSIRRGSSAIRTGEQSRSNRINAENDQRTGAAMRCNPAALQRQHNSNRISRDNMLFAERLVRIQRGPGPYNRDALLDYYIRLVY